LILLNRRGYSFAVICRACGEKLECQNCAIALTHHKPAMDELGLARAGQRLECHYCGYKRTVPQRCPKCDSEHLYYLGAGSQQGEERLSEIFPGARIGRMDRDTVRGRHDLERLLARLHSGEINLLVGTQMIAKGHDIHGVTLVGVVGCDHALSMPDFRAAERVFQLMTQVSGRAGRGELSGRVIVQTYYPDHYAILAATKHDYASFVERHGPEKAPPAAGEIVDKNGTVLGHHQGIHRYTIGQRRGIGGGLGQPQYVVSIDALTRRVRIGSREELASSKALVSELHWLRETPSPGDELHCTVQIRYRRRPQPARLRVRQDGAVDVHFDAPEFAVTAGQAAVFYDGDVVLGGGFIEGGEEAAALGKTYMGEKATEESAVAVRS